MRSGIRDISRRGVLCGLEEDDEDVEESDVEDDWDDVEGPDRKNRENKSASGTGDGMLLAFLLLRGCSTWRASEFRSMWSSLRRKTRDGRRSDGGSCGKRRIVL